MSEDQPAAEPARPAEPPPVPRRHDNVWREIAIVVIGVFIALIAQQLVDEWQWRQKVASAKQAMNEELLWDDGPQIVQRAAMHDCLVRQAAAIRDAVETDQPRAEVWRRIDGYWLQPVTYDTVAHDAATASDIASHLTLDEMRPYTLAYGTMPAYSRAADDEVANLARLHALRRTGAALSEAESSNLLMALEYLRQDEQLIAEGTRWTIPQIVKLGRIDPVRTGHFIDEARRHYGDCVHQPRFL
ncbi:hypothetical protein ABDK56_11150 [Sphingomonas sp. ASV193]|uniref:hypothetical protein n=1 Tax=Sphingomonas sp. ASV193 TaxID=3144405 RepID=UPI0032E90136